MLPIVKVSNLPLNMNSLALAHLFGQFGTVVSAQVDVDSVTGRAQGTGQVRFETFDGVSQATAVPEVDYQGTKLVVGRPE